MSARLIQVEERAKKLISEYCPDYSFQWSNTKRILGDCSKGKKRIRLSTHFAQNNGDEQVNDTILHEIAHALAPAGAKHGPLWKIQARRLGATPKACAVGDIETAPHTWEVVCAGPCTWVNKYYRKPKNRVFRVCRHCRSGLKIRRA